MKYDSQYFVILYTIIIGNFVLNDELFYVVEELIYLSIGLHKPDIIYIDIIFYFKLYY